MTSPLLTSNWAPCHGHVTTSPSRSPSDRGPPEWVQTSPMAQKVPLTLKRAIRSPSSSTRIPVPAAPSLVSATLTNLPIYAACARGGATVIVRARHLERLEGAAAEIQKGGGDVVPLRADVADRQQVQQLAGGSKRGFGGLTVLV